MDNQCFPSINHCVLPLSVRVNYRFPCAEENCRWSNLVKGTMNFKCRSLRQKINKKVLSELNQ